MNLSDNQTAILICAGGLFLTWILVTVGYLLTRFEDSKRESSTTEHELGNQQVENQQVA